MIQNLTCKSCNRAGIYGLSSLEWEGDGVDGAVDYFITCRFCSREITHGLNSLIDRIENIDEDAIYEQTL